MLIIRGKPAKREDKALLKWLRRTFQQLLTRLSERELDSSIVITGLAPANQMLELECRGYFRNRALRRERGLAKLADRKCGPVPELAQHKELRRSYAILDTRLRVSLPQSSYNSSETVHDDCRRRAFPGAGWYFGSRFAMDLHANASSW